MPQTASQRAKMPQTSSYNNAVYSWINKLYDLRSNADRVHINGHKFTVYQTDSFVQLNTIHNKKMGQCATGLKFHYAVAEEDLVKATQIIAEQADKHGIYAFKVIRKPFSGSSIKQQGKDFTIYRGGGKILLKRSGRF